MTRFTRPIPRPAPRGRVLAVVLLVLAVICLIAAIAGAVFARQGVHDIYDSFTTIAARFKNQDTSLLIVPGETTVSGSGGPIVFMAAGEETIDGVTYRYPPRTAVSFSITDESGVPVVYEPFQGFQPPPGPDQKHLLGFAMTSTGTYTIKADGGETAIRILSITAPELEHLKQGVLGMVAGGATGLCGGLGFLLFGIIGAVLFFFGKRPKPAL